VITVRGKMVFVAESFDLDLARKLTGLILDSQGTGELKMAKTAQPAGLPDTLEPLGAPGLASETWEPLTGNLLRLFSNCGAMKAAVDAAVHAGR